MTIFIFGNPDVEQDSIPLKILPKLRRRFPAADFEIKDPNEEWNVPEKLLIIDTVAGINDVQIFESLDAFVPAPRISMHDFDAYTNLRFLQKLGKLREVRIIGVPPEMPEREALEKIAKSIILSAEH